MTNFISYDLKSNNKNYSKICSLKITDYHPSIINGVLDATWNKNISTYVIE